MKHHPTRQNGSALAVSLIFTMALVVIVASALRWVGTEASLDNRAVRTLEARNAAESAAEYGFYQVRHSMENISTFADSAFTTSGAYPLTLPPTSLFAASNVDTTTVALRAGLLRAVMSTGSTRLYYVDANDPNNFNDPLKGRWVFRRDVPIYAKATVTVPGSMGPPVSAYVEETISVRGAPLFAHAVFYNMDMELAPGAAMTIGGPVHVNGDLYVEGDGAAVNFTDTVTCTGRVYHAWKGANTLTHQSVTGSSGESLNMTSAVAFKSRLNAQVSMLSGTTWKDSTMGGSTTIDSNNNAGKYATQAAYTQALLDSATLNAQAYRTYASQTWGGNLQTAANGVQNYTPVAIGVYSEDMTPADGVDQSKNTGRLLIEPPLATTDPNYSWEVEQQKYSAQAGVYIRITPATGAITIPISTTSSVSGANTTKTTVTSNAFTTPATIKVYAGGYTPTATAAATIPTGLIVYRGWTATTTTKVVTKTSTGAVQSTTVTSAITGGMYDQRRLMGETIVDFDMNVLKLAVAEMQKPAASRSATVAIAGLEPTMWNGIVYVEIVGNPSTNLDGTTVAGTADADALAVRLINGNSSVASYGSAPGLAFATNAPLYIKGNFNDDGTSPSSTVPKTGEVPAAVAADAITLLSPGFNDSTSQSSVKPSASDQVVIAAALLTGQEPSNKDNNTHFSGGAHNLIRFLENWGSLATYVRGSLVSLFESRVASEPWQITYYGPPVRNWGFSTQFLNGVYPPGTPKVISYRRMNYSDLNKTQYDAALSTIP